MVVRVHGGIINDQMLDGSLRYFDIEELNMMVNTIGDSGGRVAEASIVDAGSSYANGNVLTVSGGTFATAATLTLLTPGVGGGGEVQRFSISNAGDYSVLPTNPVSVTGGAGTLATFNLTFSSEVIVPGAAIEPGVEFYVGWQKPVPGSAADQVLNLVQNGSSGTFDGSATIVQVGLVDADTIRIAVANEGFSWDTPEAGDAAAEIQAAVRALGVIDVPDATNTGTTFDLSLATVAERTFAGFAP